MVQVRLLAPIEGHGSTDDVVDVDVETAEAWRREGKASLISYEKYLAEQPGHYSDVTGRDDVAAPPLHPSGGPQEDEPPPKKGKK